MAPSLFVQSKAVSTSRLAPRVLCPKDEVGTMSTFEDNPLPCQSETTERMTTYAEI